jgi:O-antigen/teichoic acid export membrane protein
MWVFLGQVGVALGGLAGVKILTHLLNPHEFGRFSIANTVILLVGSNVFGPLGQGLMRYWTISQNREQLADYVALSAKYIKVLFQSIVLVSFLFGLILFISQARNWTWLIVSSIVSGAFTGWAGTRLSILMAARKRKYVSLINVLTAFAKPGVAAVLLMLIAFQADIAVLGFLLAVCGSAVVAEYSFRKTASSKLSEIKGEQADSHDGNLGRSILSFSKPFFIWSFFAWAHQSCDKWALLTFQGPDIVGAYTVIAQLALYPLVFGSGLLSSFFIPIAYERAGGLQTKEAVVSGNKILFAMVGLYIAGSFVLILLFYLFHRPLVLFVSNENYVQYSNYLPMLTGAWSLYYLGQILSGFGLLANKPTLYIIPILFCGLLTTVTAFYLASIAGVLGIIWALGITGLFYASWCMLIAKRLIDSPKAV